MSEQVVIVAARRSPIGRLEGRLRDLSASDLGAVVLRDLLETSGVEPDRVSEVFLGQVLQAGAGQNPARQTALKAGLPVDVPATTINMVCGAGQKSVHFGLQAILSGDAEIIVAGGQDSMSQAPHVMYQSRRGTKMGDVSLKDSMIVDGLWDVFHDVHMGTTAEELARRYQITREEQDEFAVESHRKAAQAESAGHFSNQISVVEAPSRKGLARIDTDEHINPSADKQALARLRPVFDTDGSVTAGNASGLSDGAAIMLLMSERKAEELGLSPMARIASYASAGVKPMLMGLGPVDASRKALEKAGWCINDLDLIEVNEAFAVQSLAVHREMGWDPERCNVNGGAISMGHPLSASGARILVTLLHEMQRQQASKGLATLCIGGGQGIATCVERM